MDLKEHISSALAQARDRSVRLLAPVPQDELTRQLDELMSPLIWDLGHIGNYEEQWLLRNAAGVGPLVDPGFDRLYDPGINPRRVRGRLELPSVESSASYIGAVRQEAVKTLERTDLDGPDPLTAHGFVYGLVIQHEHQHDETMLQTLSLRRGAYPARLTPSFATVAIEPPEIFVEAGPFVMGSDTEHWAYDNERPAHRIDLGAYWIDAAPVTNAQFLAFIEAGGYHTPNLWRRDGWRWRVETETERPRFWRHTAVDGWTVRRFGTRVPLDPQEPVQHVCWYEADAFARWAGKRLPTEAEWEKAASWDPAEQRKRRFPWGQSFEEGRANLGDQNFGPAPVGAYPDGRSFYGLHQMLGDVWEWCADDFRPYPGFVAFPYPEYSAIHFGGGYKVLRGGSWATHPQVARTTFRNWDHPDRRQIFAGFRCAKDA
ncbi:MAG: ergothioneine biosynthesis protein EgtB [Actinomycetota bacterium]